MNSYIPSLYSPVSFSARNLKFGIQLIMWGYFKKVVVADRLAVLVNTVFDRYSEFGGAVIFLAVMIYCIQLYGDFSGGIDIMRGAAQTLGIEMVENFRRPYFSRSTAEFWRRWHISLGTWMRDYLFYPISAQSRHPPGQDLPKKIRQAFGGCHCPRPGHFCGLYCNRHMAWGWLKLAGLRHMERPADFHVHADGRSP
jgi:D-alanyl-lipoteichoic acid acyltransferase DltB (MBOAT superfamily)